MPRIRPLAATLVLLAACSGTKPAPATLIVYGKIWTGDSTQPLAQALVTRADTILMVGDSADAVRYAGEGTQVIPAGAGLVTPGFADGHLHFLDGGFQLASIDLRDAQTKEEFVGRLKAFAAERQPGEWILGGNWDHENWPGAPLPERSWIDSVTPRNPVFVQRLDGHMALANSLALKAAGITRATPEIPGGTIVRDKTTGEPTGVLKDEAQNPVFAAQPAYTEAQVDAALERATRHALEHGVTAVSTVSARWEEVAGLFRAKAAGKLGLRFSVYPSLANWRRVADSLKTRGPGDDWIRLAGVKGYIDGSLGSTTALFFEPYSDDPSTSGLLVTPEDSLRAWIGGADSAGLQVVVHAIGEKANALVLGIYDSVASAHGERDRRFRIEHAQHLRLEEVGAMARQHVIASMQPLHAIDDGRWAGKRLGARVSDSYVFRHLLDAGVTMAFGSDWTVASLDPMLGLYAAVTRRTLDGKNPGGWIPEEKIGIEDALRAYTAGNAYATFAEHGRGKLAPGYRADFVIADRDLLTVPPETLNEARVNLTVVGGVIRYQRVP